MNKIDQIAKMVDDLSNYTGTSYSTDALKGMQSALNVLERVVTDAVKTIEDAPNCESCDKVDLDNYEPQRDESRD